MFIVTITSMVLKEHGEQFVIGVTSSLAATFIFVLLMYEWHVVGHFIKN